MRVDNDRATEEEKASASLSGGVKKGRNCLRYYQESLTVTCSVCSIFFQGKGSRRGHGSDAWIRGCSRLKSEVVVEYEKSKHQQDANAAAETQAGVVKAGGTFSGQLAQRDEAVRTAMKLHYRVVKESIAMEKRSFLKELLKSIMG